MDEHDYIIHRATNADTSLGKTLKVFFEISGKWWFSVWLLTILSGIVSFGLTVANIAQFGTTIWVGLLLLGLAVAPVVAFHFLRIQRDTYQSLWDDKEHIIRILNEVETLRAEGVKIHIDGRQLSSNKPVEQWIEKVDEWRKRTGEKVYELHPAEAGNFNTLGLIPLQIE